MNNILIHDSMEIMVNWLHLFISPGASNWKEHDNHQTSYYYNLRNVAY